ncbi:MAG: flagellar hook-basal body complex protein [Lachnospiraceae bacterium]|nr:flagellar hook-basal body complex protein [Lachnospiraceae bacterium]
MASNTVEVQGINDGTAVASGTDVTVKGSVTLTKSQLEAEPYNLIYSETEKKYYTKDANGNAVAVGTGANEVSWPDALKAMKGLENVDNITVTDGANGSDKTISFTVDLPTNRDATYKANSFGVDLKYPDDADAILKQVFQLESGTNGKNYAIDYIGPDGYAQIITTESNRGFELVYDVDNGHFSYIGGQGQDSVTLTFNTSASSLSGDNISLTHFENIDIDFSKSNMFNNGKTSTISGTSGAGDENNTGSGRKRGEMIGVEVGQDGKITASYDNGMTKLLGQIAVANFANASGLAKAGDNLYSATMNSGEFDGVGEDITASGGTMTSGVLEMSNVDLSSEFTEMITTQRGFQANSRIITVSDTLLEELVNLKR